MPVSTFTMTKLSSISVPTQSSFRSQTAALIFEELLHKSPGQSVRLDGGLFIIVPPQSIHRSRTHNLRAILEHLRPHVEQIGHTRTMSISENGCERLYWIKRR